jgi:cytochrome c peroxidase
MQVLVPIQEHNEFNHNIVTIAEQLNWQSSYVDQSQEAYGRNPDPFVITRALATFQRSMLSGNSPYDQYLNGDASALSGEQKRGMDLFFGSKTNCTDCHNGFNFTEYTFENNGLYETYTDEGRMRFTNDSADFARFKTPTLRNIEFTGPYMFDGSMVTLEEIVEHYNSGGKSFPNKSPEILPLGLSTQEKSDLVAFLKSLSDPSFMSDPRWQ